MDGKICIIDFFPPQYILLHHLSKSHKIIFTYCMHIKKWPSSSSFKQNTGHHKSVILLGCSHQNHPCRPPINQFCQARRSSLHIFYSKAAILNVLFWTIVQHLLLWNKLNSESESAALSEDWATVSDGLTTLSVHGKAL